MIPGEAPGRRIAVIGAGPSGVYAAEALVGAEGVKVDVLDRLPCPYGLLRYGVAPDHVKMKSLEVTLRRVLEHPRVRFLGGVELGRDLTVDQLPTFYDAWVYATGASLDRALNIPGDDLTGSMPATELVAWYGGHPDALADSIALTARSAVVIGAGNVALDVTRMLAKEAGELIDTDVPQHVLDVLANSQITDIHLVARRGPAHAKYTTKELRELGRLPNVDVIVDPADLVLDEEGRRRADEDRTVQNNLDILREWSQRPLRDRPRRIHVRFLLSPSAISGERVAESIEFEQMIGDGAGGVRSSGHRSQIPAQLVVRSIGYRGVALPGVPFDEVSGTIPNREGRVLRAGSPASRQYVVGWIKRGPTGVIGTNRADAKQTVKHLLDDLEYAQVVTRPDLHGALCGHGIRVVDWSGWQAIERHEEDHGRAIGRKRVKVSDRDELLGIAIGKRTIEQPLQSPPLPGL